MPWPTFCGPASSPSPAVMRMPMISTGCAPTRPSSWPAAICPTAAWTCARSRPARGPRTCRTCAPSSAWARCWSICGCRATPPRRQASPSTSTTRSTSSTAGVSRCAPPASRAFRRLENGPPVPPPPRRAVECKPALRGYTETRYKAKSWKTERRACARIEATTLGLDIRFVVTNLANGSAEHIYDVIYCARGQAENLIKMHKSQLASDRTSCRSPVANQVRLVLHTAAYWLMLTVRDAVPKAHGLAAAEFATLRLRLLKLGARVIETVSSVRLAFAAACPEADLFRRIAITLQPAGP